MPSMRFTDLALQTQRNAPAELRNAGQALLYRAGYFSRTGEAQALAKLSIERLRQAAEGQVMPGLLEQLGLVGVKAAARDEYFALLASGADELLHGPACGYAERAELARTGRLPFSDEQALPLEKVLTPECSTIASLALFMGIPQQKTAKALMFMRPADGRLVFVVVRGDLQMSEAKLRACVGDVRMATAEEIAACGAVPGYASPIGLNAALIVADELLARSPNLVAGANEHGYHLRNTNIPRDYQPDLLADLTLALAGEPCPQCGAALQTVRGQLVQTGAEVDFASLLLALAESQHDDKGLTLPAVAAPFDVYLMDVPGKTLDTSAAALEIYDQLVARGLAVLFDDRNERAGVKFNDADLLGCPLRLTVGERALQNGAVEFKARLASESRQVLLADLPSEFSKP